MKRLILIFLPMLLSSCIFTDCFNGDDIDTITIKETISMKPENYVSGRASTQWHMSGYVLDSPGSLITINVQPKNPTICGGDRIPLDNMEPMTFFPGDKIIFHIEDVFSKEVTAEICNNSDPEIYFANVDHCMKGYVDTSNNSKVNFPKMLGSTVASRIGKNLDRNVVYKNTEAAKVNSFFRAINNFDKVAQQLSSPKIPLFSDISSDTLRKIRAGEMDPYFGIKASLTPNQKMAYICNKLDTFDSSIDPNTISSGKGFISKFEMSILSQISLFDIAVACNKVCGSYRDHDDPGNNAKSIDVDKGCFYVDSVLKNPDYSDPAMQAKGLLENVQVVENISILFQNDPSNNVFIIDITGQDVYNDLEDRISGKRLTKSERIMYGRRPTIILGFPYSTISKDVYGVLKDFAVKDLKVVYDAYNSQGKYKLSMSRQCNSATERSLYYYIGSSAPSLNPGDTGTVNMPFSLIENNNITIKADNPGVIFFAIKDPDNNFANNAGHLVLTAKIPRPVPNIFGPAVVRLRDTILKIFYGSKFGYTNGKPVIDDDVQGAVGGIFKGILKSQFADIVRAVIILSISLFGVVMLMGLVKTPHIDFLILLLKISVILAMFNHDGWKFLTENLFYWFIYGSSDLISAFSGTGGGDINFTFIDKSMGRFYRYQTWLQILSLIFAGPIGWLVMFIIVFGVIAFFSSMFRAIITFIMSMTLAALLLAISPIFITMILFKKTKALFDAWIKNLAQITIQPVFIMASIVFLAEIMNGIMHSLFSFGVCSGCILNVNLGSLDPICLFSFLLPYGFNFDAHVLDHVKETYDGFSFLGLPMSISTIIAFAIITHSIEKFTDHASVIVTSIFGAFGADMSEPAHKLTQSAKSLVGKDDVSMQHKAHQQHQDKKNKKREGGESASKADKSSDSKDSKSSSASKK